MFKIGVSRINVIVKTVLVNVIFLGENVEWGSQLKNGSSGVFPLLLLNVSCVSCSPHSSDNKIDIIQ